MAMREMAIRGIEYSRAAYQILLALDAAQRARIGEVAASSTGGRQIAPGMFSVDAAPGLRVVLRREADMTTVLALTGDVAAARRHGRQAA